MANFKELQDIYYNVNDIIDNLLELHSKLNNKEKIKYPLLLEISELENQLTKINTLRLNKLKTKNKKSCNILK